MKPCPLYRFASPLEPCSYRADGQPDACHWIPKQRLVAEYRRRGYAKPLIMQLIVDPRIITDGCRRHHDQLDGRNAIKKLMLDGEDYPESVHEYAREHGWYWVDARDGWRVNRMALSTLEPLDVHPDAIEHGHIQAEQHGRKRP